MPNANDNLRSYLQVLLDLRRYQEARMSEGFKDGLGGHSPEMRLAFGLEVILAPMGLLSSLPSIHLDPQLADSFRSDLQTSPLSRSFLFKPYQEYQGPDKPLQDLFDNALHYFMRLKESLTKKDVDVYPYSTFDHLDLWSWRLAAVVDLIDFIKATGVPYSERTSSFRENFRKELGDFVKWLKGSLSSLSECFLLSEDLSGWYVNQECSKELERLLARKESAAKTLKQAVLHNPDIRKTVLQTTRSVLSLVVVALSVFRDAPDDFKDIFEEAATALQDFIRNYIAHEDFQSFLTKVLHDLAKKKPYSSQVAKDQGQTNEEGFFDEPDCDILAHLGGILCLGRSEDLFCSYSMSQDEHAKEIQDDTLIQTWLTLVEGNIKLISGQYAEMMPVTKEQKQPWFLEPTYFLATKDWNRYFGIESASGREFTLEELEKLENSKEAFPYALGLPLFVRALAHLSFEMRQKFIRYCHDERVQQDAWLSQWAYYKTRMCPWMDRVDALILRLVEPVIRKHLKRENTTDNSVRYLFGVSYDGANFVEDLSITAGVVDALSLVCSSHLLQRQIEARRFSEEQEETPTMDSTGVSLPPGVTDQDIKAMADFLAVIRRQAEVAWQSAAPPSERSPDVGGSQEPLDEQLEMDRQWLAAFARIGRLASKVEPTRLPFDWPYLAHIVYLTSRIPGFTTSDSLSSFDFRGPLQNSDVELENRYKTLSSNLEKEHQRRTGSDPGKAKRADAKLRGTRAGGN